MRGRKRKPNARRRQTTEAGRKFHGATSETLKRQAEVLSIHGGMKELRHLARNGTLASSENPIDTLLHKKIITQDMAQEAHRLRGLYIILFGLPEARTGAYGEVYGIANDGVFPIKEAAEYHSKTDSLVAWTSRWCMGQVLNIAVFRRPADIDAVRRGLRALVIQDFVPVLKATAKS